MGRSPPASALATRHARPVYVYAIQLQGLTTLATNMRRKNLPRPQRQIFSARCVPPGLPAVATALGLLLAGCGTVDTPPDTPGGSLIVEQGPLAGPPVLVSIPLDGSDPVTLVPEWAGAAAGRWSPDGSRLVWIGTSVDADAVVVAGKSEGGDSLLIATVGGGDTATWAPDCRRIAFSRRDEATGLRSIHLRILDSGDATPITDGTGAEAAPDWSPTDDRLVFTSDRGGDTDIVVLDLSDGTERQLTDNTVGDTGPRWSPDGTRIVWAQRVNERKQIFVMGADGSEARQLTTGGQGGEHPVWSPDGAWIAYQQGGTAIAIMRSDGSDHRTLTVVGTPTDWGPRSGSC